MYSNLLLDLMNMHAVVVVTRFNKHEELLKTKANPFLLRTGKGAQIQKSDKQKWMELWPYGPQFSVYYISYLNCI
jgi:hypothetical protein